METSVTSVTLMLDQLSWPTLQTRRKLSIDYKHCTKYLALTSVYAIDTETSSKL